MKMSKLDLMVTYFRLKHWRHHVANAKTSFSELSVLSECEQKWKYKYCGPKVTVPPSEPMMKGTLVHAGVNAVWSGGNVGAALFETNEQLRKEHNDLDL